MALDAKRWGFSQMPAALKAVGAVLIPIGFFIVWLTFRENSFAAPVIKIQDSDGCNLSEQPVRCCGRGPQPPLVKRTLKLSTSW